MDWQAVEKEKALKIKETADLIALQRVSEIQARMAEQINELRQPISPKRWHDDSWEDDVRALYLRSSDMEVYEFEALLEVALRGERPEHPDLPLFPLMRPSSV